MVAALLRMPPGAGTAGVLGRLDPVALSPSARVDALVALDRLAAWVGSLQVWVLAAMAADRCRAVGVAGAGPGVGQRGRPIGVGGFGPGRAARLKVATELVERLPDTLAALAERVNERQARVRGGVPAGVGGRGEDRKGRAAGAAGCERTGADDGGVPAEVATGGVAARPAISGGEGRPGGRGPRCVAAAAGGRDELRRRAASGRRCLGRDRCGRGRGRRTGPPRRTGGRRRSGGPMRWCRSAPTGCPAPRPAEPATV